VKAHKSQIHSILLS